MNMILFFAFLVLAVFEGHTLPEVQQQTTLLDPGPTEITVRPIGPNFIGGESDDYTIPESGEDNYRSTIRNGNINGGHLSLPNTNTRQQTQIFRERTPPFPRWPQQTHTQPILTTTSAHSNPLLYNDHIHTSVVNHVRLNLLLGQQFKKYNLKFQDIDSKLDKVSESMTAINRKIDQLISETNEGFRRSSNTVGKKIGHVKAELNQVNSKVEQLRGNVDTNKAQTEQDLYTLQQEIIRVEDKVNEQSAHLWNTLKKTTHIATNPGGEITNGANGLGVSNEH